MKKNILFMVLILVAVLLGVYSWIVLPDVVTVQIGLNGQASNTMPKALAVTIPLALSVVGSALNLNRKEEKNTKATVFSLIGVAILLLNLLFNR